jgi:hypothetical protein
MTPPQTAIREQTDTAHSNAMPIKMCLVFMALDGPIHQWEASPTPDVTTKISHAYRVDSTNGEDVE